LRNDERLRTIYEVMAPYIVRNEHNWRDYLAFASQFHKHSFDNILLVYAQDEDVSILATRMGSHRQKFDSPCKGRCRLRLPECQTHS
jgi:hypothetical protein